MSEEKKDYGATLNLPKTDFPMRASLPENEPKIKERVFDKDLYKKILKKNSLSIAVGDEGGFAPDLSGEEEALYMIV